MRDSILRVIDDLDTKHGVHVKRSLGGTPDKRLWNAGVAEALDYALSQLRKVLDDHADANRQ